VRYYFYYAERRVNIGEGLEVETCSGVTLATDMSEALFKIRKDLKGSGMSILTLTPDAP
jgi:hypothetical protein